MDEFQEYDGMIEKIDTSKHLRKHPSDLLDAIIEIQVKINEIIDVVNIAMMPDEPLDDDDEDEPTVVSPSQITLGNKKSAK